MKVSRLKPGRKPSLLKQQHPHEYQIWVNMKYRCNNPNAANFRYYGAKGIFVCSRWLSSFKSFIEDMGPRPEGMTLERKELTGPYSPENCIWATQHVQSRNKSSNVYLELDGQRLILSDWSRLLGISVKTLICRNLKGWPTDKILTKGKFRGNQKEGRLLLCRQ